MRIQYEGAWYHVMNRGRRGQDVFQDGGDYACFIRLLQETAGMWNLRVAVWCLMPNHYHLLVQTPDANLSRCMQHLNGVYTQRCNRTRGGDGPLFRGRYKSILVDADSYLLELVKYIHRNPVRAGIAGSVGEYAWSSHQGYVSSTKTWSWLYTEFVLNMLAEDSRQQRKAYRELMEQDEAEEVKEFFSRDRMPAILGGDGFVEGIRSRFSRGHRNPQVPQSRMLAVPVARITQTVADHCGTTPEALAVVRRGVSNEPRDVAIYLARKLSGSTLSEIGRAFNVPHYSSVSSVLRRVTQAIGQDVKLGKRIAEIEARLKSTQTQM